MSVEIAAEDSNNDYIILGNAYARDLNESLYLTEIKVKGRRSHTK